jgi:RNA polymerase sporulation-specific sigma factor
VAEDFSRMSDEELAARVAAADAFAELASRYLGVISSIARKLKGSNAPEEEDLLQEGLVGLYEAALRYVPSGGASFKTYASVCISNRLKNEIRNHGSKRNYPLNCFVSLDELACKEEDALASPESALENRETFEAVLNQIHISLSDFERKVLAFYLSGYKRGEIAQALAVSAKAFDNALQRVRRKLKKHSSQ